MPSWDEWRIQFAAQEDAKRASWVFDQLINQLRIISALRADRNVIFYASGWLQKPTSPPYLQAIVLEDLNGIMTALYGLDCTKGLTLILHTPGGDIGAAQAIGSYLHSKFKDIECIVPTFAMSAGTMLALGCDNIVMGKQSQLGPIDAQMFVGGRQVSAGAVMAQFERASKDILKDAKQAHVWAPIMQSLGPSLLQEAQYGLDYGQTFVTDWLEQRMFKNIPNAKAKAEATASYFNATHDHKAHGRRIDRTEAAAHDVVIEELEKNAALQDAVLSAYHLMTIIIETGPAAKIICNSDGRHWVKNFLVN